IDRAVAQVYGPADANRDLEPHYGVRDQSKLYAIMRYGVNRPEYQNVVHETAVQGLLVAALLACGESYQNPYLFRRLSFVLASDAPYTFDRAVRLQMLANLSAERWQPWFERDYRWLTRAYDATADGALAYEYGPNGPARGFNNANAQYGTLALWS